MLKRPLLLCLLFFGSGCVGANCPEGTVEVDGFCEPGTGGTGGNAGDGGSGGTDATCPQLGMECGSSAVGACSFGAFVCDGALATCVGSVEPAVETCDEVDNDCDGDTDEDLAGCCQDGDVRDCGSTDVGPCMLGTQRCTNGVWQGCEGNVEPQSETCDNVDNDCDGTPDNGNPGGGAPCGDGTGVCEPGVQMCVSGMVQCVGSTGPSTEVCNGLNDDCDGDTDEGLPNCCNNGDTRPCGSSTQGLCRQGTQTCANNTWGACNGNVEPVTEICDNRNNDCDGAVDEGNPGGGAPCGSGTGECVAGTQMCTSGTLQCVGAVGPTTEICDNKDNDCNNVVDDGNPGGGASCGTNTGECTAGVRTCTNGSLLCAGEVGPSTEVCNGLDDDCDGTADDGGVCPTDCIGGAFQGHTYIFCQDSQTRDWDDASSFCLGLGGRLISINSAAEQAFVEELLENLTSTFFALIWAGGHQFAVFGQWTWADTTQFWFGVDPGMPAPGVYSNWASSFPNNSGGQVVAIDGVNGKWLNLATNIGNLRFICEFP